MIPKPYHWLIAALISSGAHVAVLGSGRLSTEWTAEQSSGAPDVVWGVAAASLSQRLEPVETGSENLLQPRGAVHADPSRESAELREPDAALAAMSTMAPDLVPVHEIAERPPSEILEPERWQAENVPAVRKAGNQPKKRNRKTASLGGPVGQPAGEAGTKKTSAGGSASTANYAGRVLSHLRRFKRYPAGARAGTVRLVFILGSNGSVRSVRITGSSGSRVLDNEAVATVQRASPFPSFPSGVKKAAWTFAVPIKFAR